MCPLHVNLSYYVESYYVLCSLIYCNMYYVIHPVCAYVTKPLYVQMILLGHFPLFSQWKKYLSNALNLMF